MTLNIGVASLGDMQPTTVDGGHRTALDRVRQIVDLGVLTEKVGLDHFGVGEHHNRDFVVSSPAVVLAAVAAKTDRIRLTSSVSNLSALDPVRLYEDFANLDLVSSGRAEIIAGRSAYPEPFALFGNNLGDYEALFDEKIDLLLRLRMSGTVTWQGRFRPPLVEAQIEPRALQLPLPVWIGVGGTPTSAARAGRLGLPMIMGYIGGDPENLRQLADIYRAASEQAGHADTLEIGVGLHYFGLSTMDEARALYRYYYDFLRPKHPGGGGFEVTSNQFELSLQSGRHLAIGTADQVIEKMINLVEVVGITRIQALVDWGGLPRGLVEDSVEMLGRDIAPAIRSAVPSPALIASE